MKDWVTIPTLFADEMTIDYTSVLGGEAQTLKGDARMEFWGVFGQKLDKFHHAISTITIDLPQPAEGTSQPTEVAARFNSNVTYVQESAKNGSVMNAGGRYEYRLKYAPDAPGNPWKLSYLKADPVWFTGNAALLMDPENA
ncbi:hypothetical protein BDV98DRAFT_122327 [Pterulicium gracile]|uniref:SnoaL-like domain-containing protein n=1 Tax=Pterulicium gracile TaxID=1884261 RepID=A0A5C3QDT4_9AGAR|nr:hypothetical protein BDV98DRAFT_122327 [Pterula gracilis]